MPIFVPHEGCPHTCSFCDQRAISGRMAAPSPEEVRSMLEAGLRSLGERARSARIAFFGGSFTAISRQARQALLEAARPYLGADRYRGIRISTRPDCIDEAILAELRSFGVDAIELGAQSMDDNVLAANGRGHRAEDTVRASALIRRGGFQLGHQMMTGLYGSAPDLDLETAKALIALGPDTVRIYPTLVLEGTELARLWRAGNYIPQSLDEALELTARLLALFRKAGIPVIRAGLHDDHSLEGKVLAGPHHPALRELAEGKMLFTQATEQLDRKGIRPGAIELAVHPRWISRMAGQRRRNLEALARKGFHAAIISDDRVPEGDVVVSIERLNE